MSITIWTPSGSFKITWWGETVVWLAGRLAQALKEKFFSHVINRNVTILYALLLKTYDI